MPAWLGRLLMRLRGRIASGHVRFTEKAAYELVELDLGLDYQDAIEVLRSLTTRDFVERLPSRRTDEWLYVFKRSIEGVEIYVKFALDLDCVVISFHEDEA